MDDAARERLKAAIKADSRSMTEISKAAGKGSTFLRDVLNRDVTPSVANLAKITSVLGTTVDAIVLGSKLTRTVPIVGHIKDGGAVYFVSENVDRSELEQAPMPPGASYDIVAIEVCSDSALGIAEKGWLIYYSEDAQAPDKEMIGSVCVVWRADGTAAMRKLYPGSDEGHWNLLQLSSRSLEENVEVVRAAPILWMRPR